MASTAKFFFFKTLILSALSSASAFDVIIDQDRFHCESRSVKVNVTYLCNPNAICNVGQHAESIEGEVSYYGLEDVYGASNADSLFMSAHANINGLLGAKHHQSLAHMMWIPICDDSLQADQNNQNGDCPADGSYSFSTNFHLPTPSSNFGAWLLTGYSGVLVVNLYLGSTMDMVGRCKADVYTKPSNWSMPSGKAMTIVFWLSVLGFIGLKLIQRYRPQWIEKTRKQFRNMLGTEKNDENLLSAKAQRRAHDALTVDQIYLA